MDEADLALEEAALDPVGSLGIVPVAEFIEEPVEVGGEFALIKMDEFFPKQTLSLALGVISSTMDPPEVVSSLVTGMKGPGEGFPAF